ncbi:MAG: hypothetical protein PHV82_17260 [Victivallaceae bacterium]|nr:hypothetical protein [Victivallaceae bacterium]
MFYTNIAIARENIQVSTNKNLLHWKMTWCWTLPCRNERDIEYGVIQARNLGFNAMEWSQAQAEFPETFVAVCRKHKMESYYCINPASEIKQQLLPAEDNFPVSSQAGGEPPDPDIGKVISHKRRRPCFNQEDARRNAKAVVDKAIKLGFDGIALDFVGYDNLHGCYCASCCKARRDYIASHPGMAAKEAENRFAEECIVKYYASVVAYAKAVKPAVKTTCHIYPAFMPDILYGNLLPVDYCGQTVAWFFKPHWKFEKIKKYSEIVVRDENKYHAHSIGTPFIGFYCGGGYAKDRKTAERMRQEIRIIKDAGAKGIQIVELGHILADKAVSRVLAEELDGSPETIKCINVPQMSK